MTFGDGSETIVENELEVINLFRIKRVCCEMNRHVWRVIQRLYFMKKKNIYL